ncbi:MAG: hypothetical protein PCFJNLEI_00634 [Verrucomicrobiae bacterium]|nr:hypothetical protein [Verrucomicrobiae bacterium]
MNSREIFGAEIQYFRLDPRYWESILERFKATGLRCVTTYVQWGTHAIAGPDKKNPAGRFDFTGKTNPRLNLHRFLELVEKHGLNLNFRCGPFCCNEMPYGGQPHWLIMGDPNMMVWDWQNRTTQGYWIGRKEGSQPSYLHPDYLALVRHWFAATDAIALPHLKSNGGCITMLNLDNEISYIVKDSFLDSDYNPVNVRPGGYWEQFLHARKSKLRPAPRAVPDEIGADLPEYVDWLEFKTWCMSEYIRRLRAMHEENGIRDVTFMTNFNPHRPEGVPTRMPEFEAAVGPKGIVGYDFYRGVFMSYSGYHSMARVLKLMNASLRYTWSAEFMSGTWKLNLGDTRVSDDHMRFMARCALAHGCKAIAWFMFHDRDCWGDTPVSSHGHVRPSLEVLRETQDLLFNKIKNWDALVPQTDVAIIYDLASHQHTGIGDPAPCADNDLHIGKPKIAGIEAGKASAEYEGLFRLVEQCGVQPGVVDTVAAPQRLQDYRLAFLPGSPVLSPATIKACQVFVKRGGILVVSGPSPVKLGIQCDYLAQEKPEEEHLESIAYVAKLIRRFVPKPHVHIRPETEVCWLDWKESGGSHEYRQPRNLGSAILHRANGEVILFVLNHYPTAARFVVVFPHDDFQELVNLTTGETIPVRRRQAIVDVDRKSADIFRLKTT